MQQLARAVPNDGDPGAQCHRPAGDHQPDRRLQLDIYTDNLDDGAVGCKADGTFSGDVAKAKPLYGPVMNATDDPKICGTTYNRCFVTPSLVQSPYPRIFGVTGYSDAAHTIPIAYGCAQKTLNGGDAATTAVVDITMVPIPPKEVCGNGTLEPDETCDPPSPTGSGAAAICGPDCQTIEELLSSGTGPSGSQTVTGSPGDKRDPSFLWPVGGNFLAFFSDKSTNSAGSEQISMRILDPTLAPPTTLGAVLDSESVFVPNTPGAFPPGPEADNHKQPVAAQSSTSGLTYVVFADDASGSFSIVVRSMDSNLNAEETAPCPVGQNGGGDGGTTVNQTSPAVAVSSPKGTEMFFVAWQDDTGRIYGRTYTPAAAGTCGALGAQAVLSSGTNNSHVSVAGLSGGWVAVWQSGNNVVVRPIGATGAPSNTTTTLQATGHTGSSPTVASIGSGSDNAGAFAFAWADQTTGGGASTIYVQRFGSDGHNSDNVPIAISQTSNGTGEVMPFMAASPALGGSYVVAWVDQGGDGQVRGRLLAALEPTGDAGSAGGYLTNVDGTTGEFQVSLTSGRTRTSPTVAVGGGASGSPPFMAFGWADNSKTSPYGIIARRFPLPTQ